VRWYPKYEAEAMLHLPTTIPGIEGAPYDVWTNHVIFDNLLFDRIVPSADKHMVSIVRDPATRIRSACNYFSCGCPGDYADPEKWNSFVLSQEGRTFFETKRKGNNCGVDQSSMEIVGTGEGQNRTFEEDVKQAIDQADQGKLLLLVTERMVESMLVFWSHYQLHPLDVAYLSMKVQEKPENISNTTLQAEALMREWNPHDAYLHQVANKLLTARLKLLYPDEADQQKAQQQLENLNDLLFHACSENETAGVLELDDFCEEKMLDNVPWQRKRLKLLGLDNVPWKKKRLGNE